MNSSKMLFVGRYAKSPKKTARSSKSKYEDISLGTVMRTSKSRNTNLSTNANTNIKRNTSRNDYQQRASLETVRKINLNDKTSIMSKPASTNKRYISDNLQNPTNNYKNRGNPMQSKSKNSMINVKKIVEKPTMIEPKKKSPPPKPVNNITKSRRSKSSTETKKPKQKIQKTERVRKSKTNKISSKSKTKKQSSPKNNTIAVVNPSKRINIYVNPDLYLKINSLFYPHLFVNSSDNFKFFSNFELHDKYLASVISHGVMIRKYS